MHDFTLDPKILRYADFMMTLLRFYEELTWTLFGFNCPHEMQFHITVFFFLDPKTMPHEAAQNILVKSLMLLYNF